MDDTSTKLTFDMKEVSGKSADLLFFLERQNITVGEAAAILALTLGRLQSPTHPLTDEKARSYVESVMDFGHMFFAEGAVN